MRPYLPVVGIGVLLFLGGCGEPDNSPGTAPTTQHETMTTASGVASSTTSPAETTFRIEVVEFAEANGVSPERAAEKLRSQGLQADALQRLYSLVGEGVIVSAAFGAEFARADELTLFVADEESVALVEGSFPDTGLDPAKTTVEVAPEEQPDDPWDWLETESYVVHEWLDSPGPHIFGTWRLIESNGATPQVPVLAGFAPVRWSLEPCSTWLGSVLTSAEGGVALTVESGNLDCGDSTQTVEALIVEVIEDSGGEFEVGFEGDQMTWTGSAGDSLLWQMDDSIDRGPPVYPPNRSEAHEKWARSPGPEMEGVWQLMEVSNEEPDAPVSLLVGVSTIGFDGLCNDFGGLFAVSADNQVGMNLSRTLMACFDSTGDVETQVNEVLAENAAMLRVSVEDDVMTWSNDRGPQMIWSR